MLAQNISCALGFGCAQANPRRREARLCAFNFVIDAFFDTLGYCGFHLVRFSLSFLQLRQTLFPLRQLGVTERRILYDLVALIFSPQRGDGRVYLRSTQEFAQGWIQQRRLGIDVEQRWRRSCKRKRETVRVSQARSGRELRNVGVARLAVTGGRTLLVRSRNRRSGGMRQRQ